MERELTAADVLADGDHCDQILQRALVRDLDDVEAAIAAGDEVGAHRAAVRAASLVDDLTTLRPRPDLVELFDRVERLRARVEGM